NALPPGEGRFRSGTNSVRESGEACMENPYVKKNEGIRLLIERGRQAFRIDENVNFYSEKDYKAAEKKFIKHCVIGQRC
ncbi:MAG: hypothetical protein PVH87_26320, partial [Desulfobacteraceae bacterium]